MPYIMIHILAPAADLCPPMVIVDQINQKATMVDPAQPNFGITVTVTQTGDPIVTRYSETSVGTMHQWSRVCYTDHDFRRVMNFARTGSPDHSDVGPRDA